MISSTDASIGSRCKLLNAFEMSSFTIIDPDSMSFKNRLAAWVAASQPPGTPTPSWFGARYGVTRGMANALAHLDESLRQTYPMAIGLRPPQLLRRAKRVPPNKMERSIPLRSYQHLP